MKKIFCFFIASLLLFSCQETAVEKPDNLIDEEVMENILYDLALLEAIKTNNPASLEKKNITASTYVYDKYDTACDFEVDSEMDTHVCPFPLSTEALRTEGRRMHYQINRLKPRSKNALCQLYSLITFYQHKIRFVLMAPSPVVFDIE